MKAYDMTTSTWMIYNDAVAPMGIECADADEVAEVLGYVDLPGESQIVETITRTSKEVRHYTSAQFLGEGLS